MIASQRIFENRESLASSLATRVARSLSKSVTVKGCAVLAVSGGTTPALFFQHLSEQQISWDKIAVTLVDERQVPEDNPRSNAALVRHFLIRGPAARAHFVPLFKNEEAASTLFPDCTVLGMGEDGHTASFFPGGDRLAQALDPASEAAILPMSAPGAGEPRLTFSLKRLLSANLVCLHMEGQRKLSVLERALSGSDSLEMPIRAVLRNEHPVEIYWCP